MSAQARVVLATHLFREAAKRAGAAVMPRKLDPLVKEGLLAYVEHGVWELPEGLVADYEDDDAWLERAFAKPEVKTLLERAVMDAVTRQG